MSYQKFIYLSHELERKNSIRLKWGDAEVSFSMNQGCEDWRIQSVVSQDPTVVETLQVLGDRGSKKVFSVSISDKQKSELLFVKNFQKTNRYTLFRQFMKKYLEEVKNWKVALDLSLEEID